MRTDARTKCASFFSSFIFQQFLDAKALRSAVIGVLSLLSVGLPSQPSRVNFVSCIFHTSWYYIVTLFVITFYFVLPILPFSKNLTYIVTPCTIASLHDIFFVNIPISVCVCVSLSLGNRCIRAHRLFQYIFKHVNFTTKSGLCGESVKEIIIIIPSESTHILA